MSMTTPNDNLAAKLLTHHAGVYITEAAARIARDAATIATLTADRDAIDAARDSALVMFHDAINSIAAQAATIAELRGRVEKLRLGVIEHDEGVMWCNHCTHNWPPHRPESHSPDCPARPLDAPPAKAPL